jgi:hypothetical protein
MPLRTAGGRAGLGSLEHRQQQLAGILLAGLGQPFASELADGLE